MSYIETPIPPWKEDGCFKACTIEPLIVQCHYAIAILDFHFNWD